MSPVNNTSVGEIKKQLRDEGFSNIFSHTDKPGACYPEHAHSNVTCHVVIEGEIEITSGGETKTFRSGERFDVPAGEVHSAKVGIDGCTYILGEKTG